MWILDGAHRSYWGLDSHFNLITTGEEDLGPAKAESFRPMDGEATPLPGRRTFPRRLALDISSPLEDIHPIIIQGQGHTALMNVEAFSGPNGALTTLNKSQDFILVRGDKKLTVTMSGCRMRNYVAELPITRENTNSIIHAAACIDKNEEPYNKTFP